MSALTVHLSPLECRESLMHHLNRRYCSGEGHPCVSHSVSDSTEANCPLESHTGLKDTCTFNFHHLCVLNLNLFKVAFTYVLPPDHNSGPWCKMLLSSEENVVICRAHWLQNSWIHYSCFTSMCVAKKDQSGLSASLCKLSRRYLDLSFMFLCQSRVNDNVIRFSSCFGGAVRNSSRKNNVLLKLLGRIG